MNNLIRIASFLSLMILTLNSFSQPGAGSYETGNGLEHIAADTYKFVYSETLYVGPDADWQIDGEVHIYSRRIWIAPTAKIYGAGKLYIHSPGENPFYEDWNTARTLIDGNDGEFINVNIILNNPEGLELSDEGELTGLVPWSGTVDNGRQTVIGARETAVAGVLVLESADKAMVLPRVASPHLNVKSPYPGMMCYDTDSKTLAVFDGTVWNYWR